jgi:amidohydrolase
MPHRLASLRPRVLASISTVLTVLTIPAVLSAQSQQARLAREIDAGTERAMPNVVAWRRDIHQHPELGNHEVRTAKLVADELTRLGFEVRTGVAHTGVVGVLRGGKPGSVVALRADMDALPVTEQVELPFKSTVRTEYNGQEVGVMHACGHDNHVAILLGVAQVLAGMKADIPGTVKFIFQPAEEGVPRGETGGAGVMVEEGALDNPSAGAIFGLHVWPGPVGGITYRSGPAMAAGDHLFIVVKGRQTHGAQPWGGIDPIVIASQVVLGLQTIASRQINVTNQPAVITVGRITGGNRYNIIPDSVVLEGTVRTFDEDMRTDIKNRIRRTAESIAQASGATATVEFGTGNNPVTYNDPKLTSEMLPTLKRVAGDSNVTMGPLVMPSEDFSLYQQKIPGLFVFLGIVPKGKDPTTAAPNHSPLFFADEAALPVGVRTLANLALDWLQDHPVKPAP